MGAKTTTSGFMFSEVVRLLVETVILNDGRKFRDPKMKAPYKK